MGEKEPHHRKLLDINFYFANYTEWGPQAAGHIEKLEKENDEGFHVHLGAETHLKG